MIGASMIDRRQLWTTVRREKRKERAEREEIF